MPRKTNYLGCVFGLLKVDAPAPNTRQGATAWYCTCACGKRRVYAPSTELRRGDKQSCGCSTGALIAAANTKHGKSYARIYKLWRAMHARCSNPHTPNYADYGGRGITVCKRWGKFENFFADMGEPPRGHSIERKNNDGNYTPRNCCWATRSEQARNTRRTRWIEFAGERKPLIAWAEQYGHPPLRIWQRLNRRWSVEDALLLPAGQRPIKGKCVHIQSRSL